MIAAGLLSVEQKPKFRDLLERIMNQNEHALGLFYLHSNLDVGISEPSVAQLRVGISLKVEHYSALQSSRTGRLGEMFSAKLGWLAGNLYSRVATRDWSESPDDHTAAKTLVDQWLNETGEWVPRSWIRTASTRQTELQGLPKSEVLERLKTLAPPTPKEKGIQAAAKVAKQLLVDVESAIKRKLKTDFNVLKECFRD